MSHIGTIKIRQHMLSIIEDYRDDCGEIDATHLAESACQDLDGWDGNETPEEFYEVAGMLAVADENRRQHRMPGALSGLVNSRGSDWF